MPRVSVCSSVLNQSEWMKDMIQSVVNQTFTDWELIIVDDGSTEDLKAVVDSFNDERIKLHRFDENRGIPHGINHALSLATGEFVQPLAADETIWERKLEWQIAYLEANPEIDVVCGLPQNGPMGERPDWEMYALRAHNRSRESWVRTFINLEAVPIGGCSIMVRKRVVDDVGLMDQSLTIFSDHEWYLRIIEKYTLRMVPVRFTNFRMDQNSVSANSPDKVEKVTAELNFVRSKHPLIIPPTKGMITVGIPIYNMGWCVKDAINSIRAQTYQDWELFILNDASTDDTVSVLTEYLKELKDPRIRLMEFDENRGNMEAMNQMAFRANGEFFMPLAADDTIEPTFMARCLAEFERNPWLEFVATQTDFMDKEGNPWSDRSHPFLSIPRPANMSREQWLMVLRNGNLYFGQGLYRVKAISEVGGWDKSHGVISDYEMYLKLLQRENIHVIEEPLTHTRIHGKNMSLLSQEQGRNLRSQYHIAKKPYYQPRQKVVLATPFYEIKGFSPYITSLVDSVKLLTIAGIDWEFMELSGDSYVHRARNTICARFLEDPDATDLFFIDSDMSWDPKALLTMILLPHEIIGGSYPTKGKWDSWTSIPAQFQDENGNKTLMGKKLPDGSALIHADVLAGGFLRMKRSLLEKFRDYYKEARYYEPCADWINSGRQYVEFFATAKEDGLFYGEDHWFSKRLRQMGQEMFIYPNATIWHWGSKGWPGNYDQFLKGQKAVEA